MAISGQSGINEGLTIKQSRLRHFAHLSYQKVSSVTINSDPLHRDRHVVELLAMTAQSTPTHTRNDNIRALKLILSSRHINPYSSNPTQNRRFAQVQITSVCPAEHADVSAFIVIF